MALWRGASKLALALRPAAGAAEMCTSSTALPSLHQLSGTLTSLKLFSSAGHPRSALPPPPVAQRGTVRAYTTATGADAQDAAERVAPVCNPRTGETLEEIRARVFGTHIGNGERSGRKVLRRRLLGPIIASYYPEDIMKGDPLMLSLKAEKCVVVVVVGRSARWVQMHTCSGAGALALPASTSPHHPCALLWWCRAKAKLDRLRRRGKQPPKKGAGKRSKK